MKNTEALRTRNVRVQDNLVGELDARVEYLEAKNKRMSELIGAMNADTPSLDKPPLLTFAPSIRFCLRKGGSTPTPKREVLRTRPVCKICGVRFEVFGQDVYDKSFESIA